MMTIVLEQVCYDDSKYGVSTECLHFYCEDCIRGSLEAILDQGHFPCVIPMLIVPAWPHLLLASSVPVVKPI